MAAVCTRAAHGHREPEKCASVFERFPRPFYRRPTCPEVVFPRLASSVAKPALAFGFSCSATASVSERVLPHLSQASQPIFPIHNLDEYPHYLTPFLCPGSTLR